MHSEPTTAFYQGLHDASIAGRLLRRRPGADTAIRPSRFRVPQTVVRGSVSYTGSVSSQSVPDLQAIAFNEGLYLWTDPYLISCSLVRQRRMRSLTKTAGCVPKIAILERTHDAATHVPRASL